MSTFNLLQRSAKALSFVAQGLVPCRGTGGAQGPALLLIPHNIATSSKVE